MKKSLKIFLKAICALVAVIVLLAATAGIYYAASKSCTLTVNADTSQPLREMSGWGTSDCWWSDDITDEKTRNEMADLLFSESGLDLDTYRYCLYGGYDPDTEVVTNQWRLGESFLVYNEESGEYEYDWSRDAASQALLQAALERGVSTVVLFANSPHYSMCRNGRSSGHESGTETNIEPDRYQDYADYFLDITEHFISQGVPVKYISPINEPQWGWGGESPAQEGCHYEAEEAVALLKVFAKEIISRGLGVKLCALESGNIGDTAKNYYNLMMADEVLADYFRDNENAKITIEKIFSFISKRYGVSAEEIKSKKRTSDIVYVRHIAMYLCTEYAGMSLKAIGRQFGRDHSTVISARDNVLNRMKKDASFDKEIKELVKELTTA